jgi:hypothetical protein
MLKVESFNALLNEYRLASGAHILVRTTLRLDDMRLALWMADQIFGKAPQAIDISDELAVSTIDEEVREKANGAIAAILPEGDTE